MGTIAEEIHNLSKAKGSGDADVQIIDGTIENPFGDLNLRTLIADMTACQVSAYLTKEDSSIQPVGEFSYYGYSLWFPGGIEFISGAAPKNNTGEMSAKYLYYTVDGVYDTSKTPTARLTAYYNNNTEINLNTKTKLVLIYVPIPTYSA